MTPEICAAAQENDTTRLEDARDGKMYWVAKLKDGNCWMTQNLDFDLESGKSLTSEDSDVSSSWSPRTTTFTAASEKTTGFFPVQSWNLGDVVWKDPDNSNSCVSSDDLYNSSCSPYWQNVSSGWTPMTEYRTDGIVYDVNTQTYDAHYLVGNYYSWQATTAGTGGLDVSQYDEASGSICPAGWRLPYSGPSNNSRPGSFYGLLNQYDLNFSSGDNNIAKAPLFFVYAGQVDPSRGYLFNAGNVVSYWSSVVYSSGNVYLLDINPNYINPSSNYGRNDGFSVRCVAPSA